MKTLTIKLARTHPAILAMLLSGCQPEKGSESTVLVEQQANRPTLTSAPDASITLFGGLPGRGEITYAGRSGGSMLQHSFTHEGALSHPVARRTPGRSSVITTGAPADRAEGQETRFGD